MKVACKLCSICKECRPLWLSFLLATHPKKASHYVDCAKVKNNPTFLAVQFAKRSVNDKPLFLSLPSVYFFCYNCGGKNSTFHSEGFPPSLFTTLITL